MMKWVFPKPPRSNRPHDPNHGKTNPRVDSDMPVLANPTPPAYGKECRTVDGDFSHPFRTR